MIDLYDTYDEVNSELRNMAREADQLVTKHPKLQGTRLCIGSGEDFDVSLMSGLET